MMIIYINNERTVRVRESWSDFNARATYHLEKWIPPTRRWWWTVAGFWWGGEHPYLIGWHTDNKDKVARWVEHYQMQAVQEPA